VLLLDEPLSNLDAKLRERMRAELREIQQRIGITTLFVTHDQVEALSMSDRVAVMRDGNIVQVGPPDEVYHKPASAFVAHFIGGTNLVPGTVTHVQGGEVVVDTRMGRLRGVDGGTGVAVGDAVVASIRLEDVILDPDRADDPDVTGDNRLRGTVGLRLFNGPSVEYRVDVEGGQLQARQGARSNLGSASAVTAILPAAFVRILPLDVESLDPPPGRGREGQDEPTISANA